MYKAIKNKIPRDKDYPLRQYEIDCLTRVIDGTLYDGLKYGFQEEKIDGIGEYIPLRDRRPSVRYALCKIVVDDSVSLIFSEGHFPCVYAETESTRKALASIVKDSKINALMIEAATIGSVGSVAIFMRVLSNRLFFKAYSTQYLTPIWKKDAPDTLEKVVEKYKVKGEVLAEMGYEIDEDDLHVDFWFQREFDDISEIWFIPKKVGSKGSPQKDTKNTTTHRLGFVPIVWAKNLPGGDDIDGKPTFPGEAIDTQIEIDYQLSQAGRGLKYSSDPTLLIKEPGVDNDGSLVKGGGNAIVVGADGDAKLLEIDGTASEAVIHYIKTLRELALESAHGNRSNADKLSAAQSGRAMELMNQSLIWLADKLRISYGEGALLQLMKMIIKASEKYKLIVDGKPIQALSQDDEITLRWPQWYAPTYADKQTQAITLGTLRDKELISQETAVQSLANDYDIEDAAAEVAKIEPLEAVTMAANPKQEPLSNSDD